LKILAYLFLLPFQGETGLSGEDGSSSPEKRGKWQQVFSLR